MVECVGCVLVGRTRGLHYIGRLILTSFPSFADQLTQTSARHNSRAQLYRATDPDNILGLTMARVDVMLLAMDTP
jgi:hypothetical protein